MRIALVIVLSFLAGSVPGAYLAGRAVGVDIRRRGSGNVGATNALRVLGPWPAAFALAVDVGKGLLAVLLLSRIGDPAGGAPDGLARIAAGAACMAGHVFPPWLRFKGGKGVATGAAVVAALAPLAAAACLAVFIVVALLWRYVSLASVCAALVLPAAYLALYRGPAFDPAYAWFFAAAAALVVVAHRKNIRRLLDGTEPRIGRQKRG